MDLIRFSIQKPVVVMVGVILIALFGTVALLQIPYQLAPRVEKPIVTVRTFWAGASPYEIERDIIEVQERALKGLPNLENMESESRDNQGYVTLTFDIGIDMEDALLRVSNKLDEVPTYPENVDKPVLSATGSETDSIVVMAVQPTDDNPTDIYHYLTYMEESVQQYFERVPGVAEVQLRGGTRKQMHITLKPERLAAYGVTIDRVIAALRGDNVNVSAGNLGVGRYEYRVRAVSEFRSEDDIMNVVVLADGDRQVKVRDLADVQVGFEKASGIGLQNGVKGIVLLINSEPDANTLQVTDDVEKVVNELNEGLLRENGLRIKWLDDQREYIKGAISQLQQNIAIGAILAIVVLWVFLRSIAATLVIGFTIPISIIGTFIFMRAMGTTLNLVSLAGLAFAVGMLVDNAIVVLENIDRHRLMGKTPSVAAYDGTREVWGAVFASSMTTMAVFLPVVFLQLEIGMLFRDIAIAVASSVLISLVASITFVPMVSRQLFSLRFVHWLEHRTTGGFRPIERIGSIIMAGFSAVMRVIVGHPMVRIATIVVLVGSASGLAYYMFPPLEYLPEGNRDSVRTMLLAPPGLSYEERASIGQRASTFLAPYYEPGYDESPGIRRAFYVSYSNFMLLGLTSSDPFRGSDLIAVADKMVATLPGVMGFSSQSSIFGRNVGGGRQISVDIGGNSIEDLAATAQTMMMRLQSSALAGSQIRPRPELDLMYPETRFIPDGDRLASVGMSAQQFGVALDVLMDGRDIGDFKREGEKKVDLVVKMDEIEIQRPEQLYTALVPTPGGRPVPVSSLSQMQTTTGLTSIRHYERNRTFSLDVTPPKEMTLQEGMDLITDQIVPQMRSEGLLDGMSVTLSGTADSLTRTREALQWNFLLAVLITYLLMSALFGNFIYPFIIMFTVPLAGAGGLVALRAVDTFIAPQSLDMLTMLGFIILIGVVVNNAILIVHQSLKNVREANMEYTEAIVSAVGSRLRPIFMAATTSLFGMLPLVIRPGMGSEIYRGLGSVVLGGLAVSTIFTVFLIPSLLMFIIPMEGRLRRRNEEFEGSSDVIPAK